MYHQILNKEKAVAVIGLGYVGLPIALEFAKKVKVIGFDIDDRKITMLRDKDDPSGEVESAEFDNCDILFTADQEELKKATFYIVAVPTPIDSHNMPDLRALRGASRSVGKALNPGDIVVYESTVYPGCTEEECIPILEKESGLKANQDFYFGYSPERINPGDKEHTLTRIRKVVSGSTLEALETISDVYEIVVKAGIYKASSVKVAEAAKVIENTQRDLNIALMNELSVIFDRLNLNTYEVLEAAATKWNFIKFVPGLVGGHCIGVDPYYLTYKAQEVGYQPHVILSGRKINDNMGAYVGKKTVQLMIREGVNILNSRVLILGATFKENVKDIRNSKVPDIINELKSFGVNVDIIDPMASHEDFTEEYGLELSKKPAGTYDAVILAVPHAQFSALDNDYFAKLSNGKLVFIDIKGIYRSKLNNIVYWSL
jgi:UDP-N-acetyl-D-glucosamine/UDP-N-acetyl-D-galactosamine dehydrogenase